jgi:predicted transcriptional regulator of viral defense system
LECIVEEGLGKTERSRLSRVLRGTKGSISVADAAGILKVPSVAAAKMLSLWARKGWVSRVKRGLYVPVPLESATSNIPLEDPWVVADRIFAPCYIGGWSAAENWGLTEQIFSTILVMSTQRPRKRSLSIKGTGFLIRTVPQEALFGLKPVWRGGVKISVSDPARTILDLLDDPRSGGGIRTCTDMFQVFLKSENRDLEKLLQYADRFNSGAVFKRLGFLLERYSPGDTKALGICRQKLTKGNARLDPTLPADRLVTRWRLWVPQGWNGGGPK